MDPLNEKLFSPGQFAEFSKTISESDVYAYAGITGDFNPVHIDREYAGKSFFKDRIAHGMLTAGLISTVIGTRLPGPGAIYLKQDLKFTAPVKYNDTITARVEIEQYIVEKKRLLLKTTCTNQNGICVLDGSALVLFAP